jgi:hypothetical protein
MMTAHAQIPRLISYQGMAQDVSGAAIEDGAHQIRVALYETPNGMEEIYAQTITAESVGGLFSLIIGPVPTDVTFDRQYWLGISIDEGDELTPRTQLTASPYALNAAHAGFADRAGASRRSDSSDVAFGLSDDVAVVRSLNGATGELQIRGAGATRVAISGNTITVESDSAASGGGGETGWALSGNDQTVPGTNFVGTTDDRAFEIHVDEDGHTGDATTGRGRVLRFEPRDGSPNVLAGFYGNGRSANVGGVTISGGGEFGAPNVAGGNYSTVGGGRDNNAGALNTTIGGGSGNQATGEGATIAGGFANSAENDAATIAGGRLNKATGWNSTIGGGNKNAAAYRGATIAGGEGNSATGIGAVISGGISNLVFGNYGSIGGGDGNATSNEWSTVGGGRFNNSSSLGAVVAGGAYDTASGSYAAVAGGLANHAQGAYSFVGSGQANLASGNSSAVAGGKKNEAAGDFTTIAGGFGLTLDGNGSFGFLSSDPQDVRPMEVSLNDVAVFGNVDLLIGNNDSKGRKIRLYMPQDSTGTFPGLNTYYSSFEAGTQFGTYEYILPVRGGSVGDVLTISSVQGKRVQLIWQSPNSTSDDDDVRTTVSGVQGQNAEQQLSILKAEATRLLEQQSELARKINALEQSIETDSTVSPVQ